MKRRSAQSAARARDERERRADVELIFNVDAVVSGERVEVGGLRPSRSVDIFKATPAVRSHPGREADDETVALARVAVTELASEGARVLIEHVKNRVVEVAVLPEDVERELVPAVEAAAHPESDARIVNEAPLVLLHVDRVGGARVAKEFLARQRAGIPFPDVGVHDIEVEVCPVVEGEVEVAVEALPPLLAMLAVAVQFSAP